MPRARRTAELAIALASTVFGWPVFAQTSPIQGASSQAAPAVAPALPRTPDGHPDFQGVVWTATFDFFAPLESSPMTPAELVLPEDKAQEAFSKIKNTFMSPAVMKMIEELDPEVVEILKKIKGFPIVRGERHTRLLVLPANGRLPLTPEARKDVPVGLAMPVLKADNPEDRMPSERCLSTLIPITVNGDLPLSFIQTPDHIVIDAEYADVRIIPFARSPEAAGSIARWEGDTLVIETTGFNARDRVRPLFGGAIIVNAEAKVIERFTRASADELVYQYTVEDPKAYTAPWLAEYSLFRASYRMYPSNCHEGNYSLANILSGQRVADARVNSTAGTPQ
jgi:hypothetical protein